MRPSTCASTYIHNCKRLVICLATAEVL
jgi:hypothetical protein